MAEVEYHITDPTYRRTLMKWYARCKCGYAGPDRDRRVNAEDDGTAHEIAENSERRSTQG